MFNKNMLTVGIWVLASANAFADVSVQELLPAIQINNRIDNQINHHTKNANRFWTDAFAFSDNLRGSESHEQWMAASVGGVVGGHLTVSDNLWLGTGYAYMFSDIDSHDTNTNTGFIYAMYNKSDTYARGIISYGISNFQYNTVNNFAAQLHIGKYVAEYTSFEIGGRYINVDNSDEKQDFLTVVGNIEYKRDLFITNNLVFIPSINVGLSSDIERHSDLEPCAFYSGVATGLKYYSWNFEIGYDFSVRHNFISHAGHMKIKYVF